MSKSKMEILTELPKDKRGRIRWKQTIGMTIEVDHEEYGVANFRVTDYNLKSRILILDYNRYILKRGIKTSSFINGHLGAIMNITNSSRNTFHLDENNILHIYGENKNGKWEALYSGNYVNEVMNSSWNVNECNISTSNYNFQGKKTLYLHHVDIKPQTHMVIDHIYNPYELIDKFYDCRIENLREVRIVENNRNKKCRNEWGYTGLKKDVKGWYSRFKYIGFEINTKIKYNLDECILDNLIAQKHLGYKHQEEEFYKLDGLSEERILEVTDLLDIKMKNADDKTHEVKEYEYDIEEKYGYYILKKNGYEMLFDCGLDYIKDKIIYPIFKNNGIYWGMQCIEKNIKIQNRFHRSVLEFKPNEYEEYKINVDHLNNNPSDNRFENLAITTYYSNLCNIRGIGYTKTESNTFQVKYMRNYRFWYLIGGIKQPSFKTEQEAIQEVERRKAIINNARVKLKNKQELDELIKYCLDNQYILENGLADLDLGYLYWKGILEVNKAA